MKNAKVSVIVPVYNVESYLPTCLDSLVKQTMQELEILVVNDGATDNSAAIAKEYEARYPDLIRVFDKENGGLSDARNYALPHATGEYIAFVDSDDYVEVDMYEQMYNKAHETDADVVVCSYADVRGRNITKKFFGNSMAYFGHSVAEAPRLLNSANSFAWNKIYRRSFWMENEFRFPVGQWFEDSAIIYNVLGTANKVECVNLPLYYYTIKREGSITGTVNDRIFDALLSAESILNFYKKFPQTPELQEQVNYLCLRHTLARLSNFPRTKNRRMAHDYINRCYAFYNEHLPGWQECSLLCPPKSARLRTKLMCFVKRHKALAKILYVGGGWQPLAMAAYEKAVRGKRALKKGITPAQRLEAENVRKRAAIQKSGVRVMCLVQRLLDEVGIRSFADFGTLLGLIREGKLLAHDIDMDIGVIINTPSDLDRLRLHLERFGFALWRQYIFDDNMVQESYHFSGIKVDLNYYIITDECSKTWLFYREPGEKYDDNTRNIVEMSYSPIKEFRTIEIQGEQVCIPANAEQILEEKYGPTWRTPDKGWIYWLSPAATKIPPMGYYLNYRYKRTTEVNEEWYAKQKQEELTAITGYQQQQLSVLKAVADLCQKHELPFYLADNTLRFAKQYQGSAPWEANLHLAMKKQDYDAFIEIAKKELPEDLLLQHSSTLPHYWLPHLTIRSKDASTYWHANLARIGEDCGPCVYVLPLLPVPAEHSDEQQKLAQRYAFLRRVLAVKSRLEKPRSRKMRLYAAVTSFRHIHKQIDDLLNTFAGQDCAYLMCMSSPDAKKSTYPKAYFDAVEYVPFADTEMPLPTAAHEIAEQRYGYRYANVPWNKREISKNIQTLTPEDTGDE